MDVDILPCFSKMEFPTFHIWNGTQHTVWPEWMEGMKMVHSLHRLVQMILLSMHATSALTVQVSNMEVVAGWTNCGPAFHLDWILNVFIIFVMLPFGLKKKKRSGLQWDGRVTHTQNGN